MIRIIKFFWGFNFAFCLAYSFNARSGRNESFFKQKLDHFDLNNADTWLQRYWYNYSWYRPEGAILLFIHDAYTISEMDSIDERILSPLAKILNASIFHLEHRFYGKSQPKKDMSLANLQYLSSDQALSDVANFIKNIAENHQLIADNKKLIALGISYGGTLATWVRYKYPELIDDAVAINAPLLAKVDFAEYYQNIADSLNSYSPKCSQRVATANKGLKEMEKQNFRENIIETLRLCGDMTVNDDDVSTIAAELATNFAKGVDLTGMRFKPEKRVSVRKLCDIMTNSSEKISELLAYSRVNNLNLTDRWDSERECFDYGYDSMMEKLKKIDYDDDAETSDLSRPWMYQSCNEFGHFKTSSQPSDIFQDLPVTYFVKQCQELFGTRYNMSYIEEKVSRTNEKYGGLEIDVNRTTFVYDAKDPWRNLFIVRSKTDFYNVIKIDGLEHFRTQTQLQLVELGNWFTDFLTEAEKKIQCHLSAANEC